MYIEFTLPTGSGGMIAAHVNGEISNELYNWSTKYSITYNTKTVKYTKRVTFDDDKLYNFFALTWAPPETKFKSYLLNYRLIEPMNRV